MNRLVQIVIFFLILCACCLTAQDIAGLPKLFPSYSEDFSDYKSFPSICFDKAYEDENGKLWLIPCGSARANAALHLFQFDGYNFKFVRGAIEQISDRGRIIGMKDQNTLVGYDPKLDSNLLFFYDLQNHQLQTQILDIKGELLIVTSTPSGRIFLVVNQKDQFILAEWKEEQLIEIKLFDLPTSEKNLLDVLFLGDKEAWFAINTPQPYIIRYQIETGNTQNYDLSDFGLKANILSSTFSFHPVADLRNNYLDSVYFFLSDDNQEQDQSKLYKFNSAENTFELTIKRPVLKFDNSRIFQDDLGNLILLFLNKEGQYEAILEDTVGERFDYAAFFSFTKMGKINSIQSPNFKERAVICTDKGIVVTRVTNTNGIRHFLKGSSIRAMVELPNQQFMVTSHDVGAYLLDLNNSTTQKFTVPDCPFEAMNWSTAFYKNQKGEILFSYYGSIISHNPHTKICQALATGLGNLLTFTPIDKDRLFIIAPRGVVHIYQPAVQKAQPLLVNSKPLQVNGFVNGIYYDQKEIVWVASSSGLWKINIVTQKVDLLGHDPPFMDSRFLCLTPDDSGRLWLGTPLGGLHIYNPATEEVIILNDEGGLGNNTVANIVEDADGDWWLGTYNGISVVNDKGELLANFGLKDGLVDKENNRYAALKAKDGKLLIGTINGLNVINPQVLKANIRKTDSLKIYLTSLEYFDSKEGSRIARNDQLDDLGTLQLSASHRFLNVSFALSNYFRPKENQYAYMLEGIDEDWKFLGAQPSLSLGNLPPGKYQLLVRGSDPGGNWTEEPFSITIHAKEFFYKQPWFYLLIFALIGSGVLFWIRRLRQEVRKATKKIVEDKAIIESQAERLKDIDKAKSTFFTNISHELRTPLTVISGLAGRLNKLHASPHQHSYEMILRNSNSLLNLVNQILDLRKLESGKLQVDLVQADIISYLKYIFESFESFAQTKNIQAHLLLEVKSLVMDYDKKKVLRVISNLLSNAIKFTPEGGDIYFIVNNTLGVLETPRVLLTIKVKDTGIGISANKLPHIFDRFYQADDSSTREGEGTGIGLALCKELVALLGGTIEVESEVNVGSTFTIQLPITNQAPLAEEKEEYANLQNELNSASPEIIATKHETTIVNFNKDLPVVLLVEDNADVVQYLMLCLESEYNLLIARDGQEGIEKAIEHIPDAIISDVMMPHKDGFEVCHTLKTDQRTSHIPIILLTAKADIDSRLSGLRKGADDYLIKPFNEEELLTRLENQMAIRHKLQLYFQNAQPLPENVQKEVEQEHEFLKKIRENLEANLDQEDYGILQICRAIGMSRAQLHRKIKALTGQSITHYLRKIRLHNAKKLLETTDLNVTEVAFEVGFRHVQNFSTAYLEEFGIQPSKVSR